VKSESRHQLELLEALSENAHTTQRGLASRVGIALGLTNIYLRRLVHKGYVKCVNARSNRLMYMITPTGLAEKTRLTYEFMEYSLRLYRNARTRVRAVLEPLVRQRHLRIALYGSGEPAELAYICLRELGVEPVAIFNDSAESALFNLPVRRMGEPDSIDFDLMIVATFSDPEPILAQLEQQGICRDRLVAIRESR
jgi:DNA-binding Lrp family transcriptional regulator